MRALKYLLAAALVALLAVPGYSAESKRKERRKRKPPAERKTKPPEDVPPIQKEPADPEDPPPVEKDPATPTDPPPAVKDPATPADPPPVVKVLPPEPMPDALGALEILETGKPPAPAARQELLVAVRGAIREALDDAQRKTWEEAAAKTAPFPNPIREARRLLQAALDAALPAPEKARPMLAKIVEAAKKAAESATPASPGTGPAAPALPAGADPAAEFANRTAAAEKARTADAWLKAADFAEQYLLWPERRSALKKAIEIDPDNTEAHRRFQEVAFRGRWLSADEAERQEEHEKTAQGMAWWGDGWVEASKAEKSRKEASAELGFDVAIRIDTPYAVVYSQMPLNITRQFASLVANGIEAWRRRYEGAFRIAPPAWRLRVLMLSTGERFHAMCAKDGISTASTTAGLYSSKNKTLYVGPNTRPDDEDYMHIALHELAHGSDNLFVPDAYGKRMMWFQEGRADYLGNSVVGRDAVSGAMRYFYRWNQPTRQLHQGRLRDAAVRIPLKRLFAMPEKEFMASGPNGNDQYILSWAFVHFLFHGDNGRYLPGFRRFLEGFPDKAEAADFESCVGRFDVLQPAFQKHLDAHFLRPLNPAQDTQPLDPGSR
ncbi:MAG: hypothetical protein AAB215_01445 [Planctomycetota bacterium]